MRLLSLLVLALWFSTTAQAGMNRNYLVPYYDPCPGPGVCNPSTRPSSYTFDAVTLSNSRARYILPGKLALAVSIKGLKDGNGTPVTGTVQLRVTNRLVLSNLGTVGETSPLSETVYSISVTNGNGRAAFKTPPETPTTGLVVNTITSPILYDPDSKPLASTGTQAKP